MKAKIISDDTTAKKGDIIDHPKAFRLVQLGVADPVDDECRIAAGMTPEKTEAARAFQRKAKRGLQEAVEESTPTE